jgi:hypothetical protein
LPAARASPTTTIFDQAAPAGATVRPVARRAELQEQAITMHCRAAVGSSKNPGQLLAIPRRLSPSRGASAIGRIPAVRTVGVRFNVVSAASPSVADATVCRPDGPVVTQLGHWGRASAPATAFRVLAEPRVYLGTPGTVAVRSADCSQGVLRTARKPRRVPNEARSRRSYS